MLPSQPPPSSRVAALPGSVLAGKYRVDRVLGQGGMGLVVEARHLALQERVALKFLLPEYAQRPEAAGRFLREARAAVKIRSEHVARVTDVGTLEDGAPYMVMEFLEGADLSRTLTRFGVLKVEEAVDYVIQACEALAEAHTYGIVHRDLKPANLFLARRPDGTPLIKVLDFGISKMMDAGGVESLTQTRAAIGSALYMSPEQMRSSRDVDYRTDIYALGVTLFELVAGVPPYHAESLTQLCAVVFTQPPTPLCSIRPDAPIELQRILEKAIHREREQRYQNVAELVFALAPFAPMRSQGAIDSVARMCGAPAPVAGTRGAYATAARPAPQASRPSGTELMIDPSVARGSPASPWADRTSSAPAPASMGGGYSTAGGPPSAQNAQQAATGVQTSGEFTTTQRQPAGGAPLIVLFAGLAVLGAAIGAAIVVRTRTAPPSAPAAAPATAVATAPSAAPAASAAPAPSASGTPVAQPAPSASAAPAKAPAPSEPPEPAKKKRPTETAVAAPPPVTPPPAPPPVAVAPPPAPAPEPPPAPPAPAPTKKTDSEIFGARK